MEAVARDALWLLVQVGAPLLLAALAVAVLISLFQAATQILEPTLAFVPKLVIVIVVLVLLGSWMGSQLVEFARDMLTGFPGLIE